MRQVALLVYPEVSLAQLTGMAEIFYFANELHRYQHPAAEPLYQLQYVQLDGAGLISQGPLSVQCQAFSSAVDLLLLAGGSPSSSTGFVGDDGVFSPASAPIY